MAVAEPENLTRSPSTGPGPVTSEVVLWAAVGLTALAMRLAQLGTAPLSASEASSAAAAWRVATGHGPPLSGYSPVLLTGNGLLFTLFGAGDAAARLLPALFGSVLVLTPILMRRSLGRVGALAAGAYLTVSPTALIASRHLDGTTAAAVGVLAAAGAVLRFLEGGRTRWLTLAALGLALGVCGGEAAYGLLLPLGAAALAASQLWREERGCLGRGALLQLRSRAPRLSLVFVVGLLGIATGLGWNLAGLASVGGLLGEWLQRFRQGLSVPASPFVLLLVYELFGVAFGLGALVWGLLRDRQAAIVLGIWAALAGLLLLVMPGRRPTDLLWVVVPLALLAGMAVRELLDDRWSSGAALRAVYGGIVLILCAYGYLMLGRYAYLGERADLALVGIAVALQALVGLTFGLILGTDATVRTAMAGVGVALLASTLSAGWGVAYGHPADPREPLLSPPTALNVRDLVRTLEDVSWNQTGMPRTLDFVYEAPEDSVLAWYLRDFGMARRVVDLEDVPAQELTPILVTRGLEQRTNMVAEPGYIGQDFALQRTWAPRDLGCRFWRPGCHVSVDWFLYRQGPDLPQADQWVTLWRPAEASYSE